MDKHFMIDIETTGFDQTREEILEVAILELDFKDAFWQPGRLFHQVQGCRREPANDFALRNHVELYAEANAAYTHSDETWHKWILHFFNECQPERKPVNLMGLNLGKFDLPFLEFHGWLHEKDYHYRLFDITTTIATAQNVLGIEDRNELIKKAESYFAMPPSAGKPHRARYDVYRQLGLLNGIIRLMREAH